MAKRSNYVCQNCGYSQVGWAGKCPNCGTWGSLVETLVSSSSSLSSRKTTSSANIKPQNLSDIKIGTKSRFSTKIPELDRVLGGGIVSGQVLLLAGEPGIGKSTILLQLAQNLGDVLYVSGEESAIQVRLRADRLKVSSKNIKFLETTDVDAVVATLESLSTKPNLVIVDSIQTMATTDLSGVSGSVGQVRECASRLLRWAKTNNTALIMVGHVTKQGSVAGPAVLSHIVDSVLWFEGDKTYTLRLLRAVKNRFGPTDEVGLFTMEQAGLASVNDAAKLFFTNTSQAVAGSVATSVLEGSRPMLVEVQSLVVSSKTPYPKRVTQGVDSRRVEMLLGVLARRSGMPVLDYDVYVNVAGGLVVRDPSADLAIALSIASALKDKALPKGSIALGEVGLLGEIREVPRQAKRISEAKRQGFSKAISSKDFSYLRLAIQALL